MAFHQRLREARKRRGMTQAQLGAAVGVAKTTIAGYEAGHSVPDAHRIGRILGALEIDANTLWPQSAPGADFAAVDAVDRPYLRRYLSLDAHGKHVARLLIDAEADRMRQDAQTAAAVAQPAPDTARRAAPGRPEVRSPVSRPSPRTHPRPAAARTQPPARAVDHVSLRVSTQSASAGTGIYLDPDDFVTLQVPRRLVPGGTMFGIPVRGDSMEPRFGDGDILLIAQAHPEIGEVGVFIMDGEGYVKIRGQDALLSLNERYAPIPMDESIHSVGKVIGKLDPGE